MKNNQKETLFNLFSKYFWLGIVLVLLAIVIELQFPARPFAASALVNLTESIGIAIVVASIFTYVSGTSEFISKISQLLQSIVIGRNFLGNIDPESKREALSSLIKPSLEEKRIYSNIEDYLNTYIQQTMDITNKCVRSNYVVNGRAYICTEKGRVRVDSKIAYRLYPKKDGYDAIKVGFLDQDTDSTCKKITINTPQGKRDVHPESNLKFENITIDAGQARIATIDLSHYAKTCSHLDISLEMSEYGSDHWIMLNFCTLMPTDGFRHTLRCDDGLKISTHHTFIHGAQFFVDNHSDNEITTSCTEWINEGTGLSVLISIPHKIQPPNTCQHQPPAKTPDQ